MEIFRQMAEFRPNAWLNCRTAGRVGRVVEELTESVEELAELVEELAELVEARFMLFV